MTQLADLLQPNTLDLIESTLSKGTANANIFYHSAYAAIYQDLVTYNSAHPGLIDSGTLYWFSQAGDINSSTYRPNPAGI